MNNQAWVYLSQLTRALQAEGVDGRRAGDFVAEIDSHLTETYSDPVEEFGTPFELASEMATRPGSRRPGWVPPLWAIWILALFVSILATAAIDSLVAGSTSSTIDLRGQGVASMSAFMATILIVNRITAIRLSGRSWSALFDGPTIALILLAAVITTTVGALAGDRVVLSLPPAAYWALFGVALVALLGAVAKWNNPIRFPESAPHLKRLSRGPFARQPADQHRA
jgi:hypothetical protein